MTNTPKKIAKFEKVSFEQFKDDWINAFPALLDMEQTEQDKMISNIMDIYNSIKLPERASVSSAGYDFFSPITFTLDVGDSIKIPTGIRCKMDNDWVLMCFPRSGFGFKYGMGLANHTGIIDADFYNSSNEGHIHFKLVNDSSLAKKIVINSGTAFCQSVFVQYGITKDDNADTIRDGGFGSSGM